MRARARHGEPRRAPRPRLRGRILSLVGRVQPSELALPVSVLGGRRGRPGPQLHEAEVPEGERPSRPRPAGSDRRTCARAASCARSSCDDQRSACARSNDASSRRSRRPEAAAASRARSARSSASGAPALKRRRFRMLSAPARRPSSPTRSARRRAARACASAAAQTLGVRGQASQARCESTPARPARGSTATSASFRKAIARSGDPVSSTSLRASRTSARCRGARLCQEPLCIGPGPTCVAREQVQADGGNGTAVTGGALVGRREPNGVSGRARRRRRSQPGRRRRRPRPRPLQRPPHPARLLQARVAALARAGRRRAPRGAGARARALPASGRRRAPTRAADE